MSTDIRDIERDMRAMLRTQVCAGPCHRSLPLTEAYWHKDPSKDSGLHVICKDCRCAEERARSAQQVVNKVKDMDAKTVELLSSAVKQGDIMEAAPHMVTVLEDLMRCFGGSEGFSRHVFAHYLATSPGSAARTKVLQMVLDLVKQASKQGEGAKQASELINSEDIDREINRRLRKMVEHGSDT